MIPDLDHSGVNFTKGELLVIDFTICAASHIMPGTDLPSLLDWHELRITVWDAVNRLSAKSNGTGNQTINLPITMREAKELLALVPTTFRWGSGPDDGYSCKNKLAMFLRGEYDNKDETHNSAGDQAAGGATA